MKMNIISAMAFIQLPGIRNIVNAAVKSESEVMRLMTLTGKSRDEIHEMCMKHPLTPGQIADKIAMGWNPWEGNT